MSISQNMDKIESAFNTITDIMDKNSRGVKIGCYSVAFIGLTIAVRRVRPFSRFRQPSDIPNHFISERRELIGTVVRIEPSDALLMVNHKPIISLSKNGKGVLPVKISGVRITGHGINWLQAIVAGQKIKFIPILKEKKWVQCEVFLEQQTHDKKLKVLNIGESLISVGFAALTNIEKPLTYNAQHIKYYKCLKAAQENALRKRMGVSYYIKPTQEFCTRLAKTLSTKIVTGFQKSSSKATKHAVA